MLVAPVSVAGLSGAGQSVGMTRYRPPAVLLLFLLLHLTGCQTWYSVSLDAISPAQLIEEDQPDRVRVTKQDGTQVELENPSVEGDELVASGGFSMPSADVVILESRKFSMDRTMILLGGVVVGVLAVAMAGVLATIEICDGSIC